MSQYLRLARKAIALSGLDLISVTPESRLNDFFPVMTAQQASELILHDVGDPSQERTRGLYSQQLFREVKLTCKMQDFPPHQLKNAAAKPVMTPKSPRSKPEYDDEAEIIVGQKKIKSSRFGEWCQEQIKANSRS